MINLSESPARLLTVCLLVATLGAADAIVDMLSDHQPAVAGCGRAELAD